MTHARPTVPATVPPFAGELTTPLQLASVLDHVPAVIGLTDLDLRHRFANWAHGFWYGPQPHEVIGLHASDLIGPELFEESRPYFDAVRDGVPQAFERTVMTTTGERRHTVVNFEPYVVDDRIAGVLILASDATARVRAEFARRELARRLSEMDEKERVAAETERVAMARLDSIAAELAVAAATDQQCRELVLGVAAEVADAARALREISARRPHERAVSGPEAVFRARLAAAADRLGFTPELVVLGVIDDLDDAVTAMIVEVLDEALSNVVRHAGADRVDVTVSIEGRDIVVVVWDDGRGVVRAREGSGLDRLRRRAQAVGGRCTWVINDEEGTTLEWRVPLAPATVQQPSTPDEFRPDPASARGVRYPEIGYRDRHGIGLDQDELRAVLNQVPMGLTVWDAGVRNQYANSTGAAWLQRQSPGQFTGRHFNELVPPDTSVRIAPLAEAALAGTHTLVERDYGPVPGVPIRLRTEYVPRSRDGVVDGLFVQVTDIGAQTRTESAVLADADRMSAMQARHQADEDAHHEAIQQLFAAALRLDTAQAHCSLVCAEATQRAMAPFDEAIAGLRRSVVIT